jgi:L-fucose isomerase-like protein
MSMMSNLGLSSACEVDIMGTVAMYALAQAGGRPSALVDWNNNYGDDPDKGVIFHCSNLPKDLFVAEGKGSPVMDFQEIIAGSVGKENTYGTVVGRLQAAPFSYLRVSTDDSLGWLRAYCGEGEITSDPLTTLAGGVVKIPDFSAVASVHLRERLRASRGHQSDPASPPVLAKRSRNTSAGTSINTMSEPVAAP